MRVLLITSTPPIPSWGGAMTFYRHFCDRNDFEISVVTDNPQILAYDVPYDYTLIEPHRLWQRLSKTRFSRATHTWNHLVASVPSNVIQQAKDFDAQAIFTVAGSWSWMAGMAGVVARRLNIPLVGSFNDWWDYNTLRSPWADGMIEQTFRQFYRRCDLAFCTSEGMQEALGEHPNSVVLYPTGATMTSSSEFEPVDLSNSAADLDFTVAFGGNLGDWYGWMIEGLISESWQTQEDIRFQLFGSNASWTDRFDQKVKEKNIFHGQVPFSQLQQEMQQVDGLLLLMGFGSACARIEQTSFKTKFLDYLSFQKPILLWGPDYCSAVRIAQEFDSAEICTSASAHDFLSAIRRVKSDKVRRQQLVKNANIMYKERFHPDKIHQRLVTHMNALIA